MIASVTTDMIDFLGLEATTDDNRWRLPVTLGICGQRSMLYGSCALAASVEAAERATRQPLVWAACHFLRPAPVGSTVELLVEIAAAGQAISHGRVAASVDGDEVFTTMVALGTRSFEDRRLWATPPPVRPPLECAPLDEGSVHDGRFRARIEERWAPDGDSPTAGPPADGHSAVWLRLPGGVPACAAALAALGDLVAAATANALGRDVAAPSLDNTIRIVRPMACEWILADVSVHVVDAGFCHGTVNLWSADGDLLAVASQTGAVRPRHG